MQDEGGMERPVSASSVGSKIKGSNRSQCSNNETPPREYSLESKYQVLFRKCLKMEKELVRLGVDVVSLVQKDGESVHSECSHMSSSKYSHMDIFRHGVGTASIMSFDSAAKKSGKTSGLRHEIVDEHEIQSQQHEAILSHVRNRRFTLSEENRIAREGQQIMSLDEEEEEKEDDENEQGKKGGRNTPRRSRKQSRRKSLEFGQGSSSKQDLLPPAQVFQLPRGGIYVQTRVGAVQFGIPPETIKDSMELGLDVPTYFVVPKERFNLKLGLNMCEAEFPGYFNFFLRGASVKLICTPKEEETIRKVIEETLEGPKREYLYVDSEYQVERRAEKEEWEHGSDEDANSFLGPEDLNCSTEGRFRYEARPDHIKEINFFKEPRDGRDINVDSLIQFVHFVPYADISSKLSATARSLAAKAMLQKQGSSVVLSGFNRDEDGSGGDFDNAETQGHATVACLGNGIEIIDMGIEYIVVENNTEVSRVQSFLSSWAPAPALMSVPSKEIVDPPAFGITVLGSSHGFDPKGSTSGFVLWMPNKKGIMVDPPPNATDILQNSGIPPSMITGVILTHCHADHDAGTFQKILKEGRITLMTTQTVFDSFIRKYSIISGFAEEFLLRLFESRIVKIGECVHWGGGTLRFFYSLHALPCIGFEANVAGRTFAYSADTFYDPDGLKDLRDKGYLSAERCQALLDFPFHYDVVLHEAGIPPIHTPLTALQNLPESQRKNLYLIHTTEEKCRGSGLRIAEAGVEHTIEIPVPEREHATSAAILQLLRSTDIFRHLTIQQASDLLQLCHHATYKPGDYICREGEVGTHFFVILSGFCTVKLSKKHGQGKDLHQKIRGDSVGDVSECIRDQEPSIDSEGTYDSSSRVSSSTTDFLSIKEQEEQSKVFSAGDYLGELALLTKNKIRSADIVALSRLSLIKLDAHAFRYLLDTTPGLQYRMERLSQIRCSLSWKAIGANSVLSRLRSTQRSQLQSIMQVMHVKAGTKLWKRNQPTQYAYLVAKGYLEFEEMREELDTPFSSGAFFCNVASIMSQHIAKDDDRSGKPSEKKRKRITSRVTLVAKSDVDLYFLEGEEVLEFLDLNPGVFINLIESLVME